LLSAIIQVVERVRDLGVILDSRLTLLAHVAALWVLPAETLRPLVQSMTVEAAGTAAAAFVSCQLDYSLLYGLPDTLLHKLQSVQNATARLIAGMRLSDHISLVLRELHWLPIRERAKFTVTCLVRQSPLYLADDCRLISDSTRHSLCSADVSTCMVLCYQTACVKLCRQAFCFCAMRALRLAGNHA